MSKKCLPAHLQTRHTDWIKPLRWVPRWWTARCGWAWPAPPVRLFGRSGYVRADWESKFSHHSLEFFMKHRAVMPIPHKGFFLVSAVLWLHFIPLPMMAKTFLNGDYFSIGIARWDDVDNYYDLMRIRGHGTKGHIALGVTLVGMAALVYWVIWPFILERVLAWALGSL